MTFAKPRDLNRLHAWQAATLLARRELRAVDIARACLDRVADRERELHAFAHIDADAVLAQARALDAGPVRGPLHGLPLGVKDLFDTADMPTACGSPIYAGQRPAADAAAVALCREAGALVLGKTVTTEFAYFHPGPPCACGSRLQPRWRRRPPAWRTLCCRPQSTARRLPSRWTWWRCSKP